MEAGPTKTFQRSLEFNLPTGVYEAVYDREEHAGDARLLRRFATRKRDIDSENPVDRMSAGAKVLLCDWSVSAFRVRPAKL